ncbi:MAG: hypothetical protein ACP5PJ_06135 [Acidimicrobiales bacterium]
MTNTQVERILSDRELSRDLNNNPCGIDARMGCLGLELKVESPSSCFQDGLGSAASKVGFAGVSFLRVASVRFVNGAAKALAC